MGPKTRKGTLMKSHFDYRETAERVLPGGALGTRLNPEGLRMTIASAKGAHIMDVDGNIWIDYIAGAGSLILGHQPPMVVAAVRAQAERNMHQYAALSDVAVELAAEIVEAVPGAERMVFTTTGSEATAYAMRMARAATGRSKILKFEGAFHGNHDYAGIGVAPAEPSPYPRGMPFTEGTPDAVVDTMLIAPYNDPARLRQIAAAARDELAGIIVEPVQRIISPRPGFLEGVRALADELGAVLIFDEVVTGFRLAYGGAQEYFGVRADLATYGKIVGGGGPVGAVAGKAELIDQAHPDRKGTRGYVYASGTLHGNPLGSAAGLAMLAELRRPGFYDMLNKRTGEFATAIEDVFSDEGYPAIVEQVGSLWQILHMAESPRSYTDLLASDRSANLAFDTALMHRGINVIPGLRRFVSSAHTHEDFDKTIDAVRDTVRAMGGTK